MLTCDYGNIRDETSGSEGTYVYSIADMNAWASPLVIGVSPMRRDVQGRRLPGSGTSRNWKVHLVEDS